MWHVRALLVALSMAVLNYVLPCSAEAAVRQEGPAAPSAAEEQEYAAREAQASPELENFTGGAHGIVIGILVIAAIVIIVYLILDKHHHVQAPGAESPYAQKPAAGSAAGR